VTRTVTAAPMTETVAPTVPRERSLQIGLLLGALILVLFVVSLGTGRAALGLGELLIERVWNDDELLWIVLSEIRLPRAILAILVGGALGLSGAVLQGYLRNPLAEPGLIGASSMAAFGAVLMLYFGVASQFVWALPVGGIAGALVGVTIVYMLAGNAAGPLTLILAGVAVNALAGALTSLALSLAPSPFAVQEIVFWLLGSLADRSFDHVWLALPFIAVGSALLFATGRGLDALTLGVDAAASLGVRLPRLQVQIVLGTALAVGAAVSVTGIIGFVGLVVPHLLRPLVGNRPAPLLGLSALGGAALTLAADIVVRLIPSGLEPKLGVITAMIGAPFFLWLLMKTRRTLA
jgi:iron complex transport system permease protein